MFAKFKNAAILAMISGALLPLAFAPFAIWSLAIIAPAALLYIWLDQTAKHSFWLGLIFGAAFFGVGVSWVFVSLHRYGNAPTPLAALITALFILILAFYFALQGLTLNLLWKKNGLQKMLLAFPATTVLFEWLRGTLFTGFPWLFLGYSQMTTPLAGFASILGIYGVSFFTALSSAILVACYQCKNKRTKLWLVILLIAIWGAGFGLKKIHWATLDTKPIRVALLQGNIPQEEKWQASQVPSILLNYEKMSSSNANNDLIIWPESAIPAFQEAIGDFLKRMNQFARKNHTHIITGAPWHTFGHAYDKNSDKYFNAMLSLGTNKKLYLKRHLVPFGEYLPLERLLNPLLNYLTIPASNFSAGTKNQPEFKINNISIAPFICYEITYPELVLDYLPRANLLLTIADDSWFGDSFAPYQHLQIAQFRSLETGRYQLLATNSGITAVIKPDGSIAKMAPLDEPYVLTAEIYQAHGTTPWIAWGQYAWKIFGLIVLGVALI